MVKLCQALDLATKPQHLIWSPLAPLSHLESDLLVHVSCVNVVFLPRDAFISERARKQVVVRDRGQLQDNGEASALSATSPSERRSTCHCPIRYARGAGVEAWRSVTGDWP